MHVLRLVVDLGHHAVGLPDLGDEVEVAAALHDARGAHVHAGIVRDR